VSESAVPAPATVAGALGPDHGYGPDIDHVLLSEQDIQTKIAELAARVAEDYAGKEVLLVGVLKGAVLFMSDFARALQLPTQMEFMAVSSYGSATSSSGIVRILKDLDRDITGKHVLVLEDIIDSGLTLSWLLKNLGGRQPASLEVCALLRKPDAVKVQVPVKYIGFDIPNEFVIGYGLDYAERYRDLPYIATLRPEVYAGRERRPDPAGGSGSPFGSCAGNRQPPRCTVVRDDAPPSAGAPPGSQAASPDGQEGRRAGRGVPAPGIGVWNVRRSFAPCGSGSAWWSSWPWCSPRSSGATAGSSRSRPPPRSPSSPTTTSRRSRSTTRNRPSIST
jgi:hypoxanthine phosphoribosyltransferase